MVSLLEYPYLVNPPTLLSSKYDALELEFNFTLDNIKGGYKSIKLKYYQIFYKVPTHNLFIEYII